MGQTISGANLVPRNATQTYWNPGTSPRATPGGRTPSHPAQSTRVSRARPSQEPRLVHQGKELRGPFPPCCVERTGNLWTGPVDPCSLQTSNLWERTVEAGPGPWETPVKSLSQEQPGDPKETRGEGWEPPGRSQLSTTDKSQAKAEGVQLASTPRKPSRIFRVAKTQQPGSKDMGGSSPWGRRKTLLHSPAHGALQW